MIKKAHQLNENTEILKLIALVSMILDHTGAIFFPRILWLRVIGRIAFPLYCWCLVIGADHTRDIGRYALRLLALGLISQPFYCLALNHSLTEPNIFFTLLLGLTAIAGIRHRRPWLTALALMAAHYAQADYGLRGVLCILLLYCLRKNPYALALGFALFCLAWAQGAIHVLRLPWGNLRLSWGNASAILFRWGKFPLRLQSCAVLALPFMLVPMAHRPKLPKRLLYWAYPVHLAVLWVLKMV